MSGTKKPFFRVIDDPAQNTAPDLSAPMHETTESDLMDGSRDQEVPVTNALSQHSTSGDPSEVAGDDLPANAAAESLETEAVDPAYEYGHEHVSAEPVPEPTVTSPPTPEPPPRRRGGFFRRRQAEASTDQDTEAWDPESVAITLRNRREDVGYTIEDVAEMLRIRLPYLIAIEEADWQALPGTPYAIGFVKSYAAFLELPVDQTVDRFKDEIAGVDRQTRLVFPTPEPEARVPSLAIFLVALALGALAYGGWYLSTRPPTGLIDSLPHLPDRFTSFLSGEPDVEEPFFTDEAPEDSNSLTGREQVEPEESGTAPFPDDTNVQEPLLEETVEPPADASGAAIDDGSGNSSPESVPTSPTDGEAAIDESPTTDAGVEVPSVVEVTAPSAVTGDGPTISLVGRGMSWFQVRDQDGNLVLTRVLQEGDQYDLDWQEGLILDTGNAGGLTILLDGEEVPPVGASGEVVRGIALDPGTLTGATTE